jgi:phage baseplate assembly protein V
MRDLAASEIRRLHKKIASADRRIALSSLPGKVAQKDPGKRLLRLKIGVTSDGRDILSPWVRWQEPAAGGMRVHSEPAMGEQMILVNHSGTVGSGSIAVPGTYDQDHGAPSTSSDTAVFERGGSRIELGPDGIRLVGEKIVTEGETHLGGDGGNLLHRKGDLDSDGDAAVGSASRVYAV